MFGAQVIWNGIPFGAIAGVNTFLPVEEFTCTAEAKIEPDAESGRSRVTGRELQTCCFSVRAIAECGTDPRITYELLRAMRGMSGGVYIANGVSNTLTIAALDAIQTSDWRKLFTADAAADLAKSLLIGTSMGGCQYILHNVTQSVIRTLANGTITESVISLHLTEDAGQRQSGGLRVFVNDKDVTASIAVSAGHYEMHAEGEADRLELDFSDTKNEWSKWKPDKNGDTVRVTDGAVNTGKMYIDSLKPTGGRYRLIAYSTPKKAFSVRSRSFSGISLSQLAGKIAGEYSLNCKTYGVPESPLSYLVQRGKSDLAFLADACSRCGCAFLVFNGDLCVYSQKYIEGREAAKILEPSRRDSVTVTDDGQGVYQRCELRNGNMTGTAEDAGVKNGKIYRESVKEHWQGIAAANAAAAAKLRELNKLGKRAEVEMPIQRQLAAGSVIDLRCKGWHGCAFVYRCRHDFLSKRSHIWMREPLNF